MAKLFGGLRVEDLIEEKYARFLEFQLALLARELINGVQVLLPAPWTTDLDQEDVVGAIATLPAECGIYVHGVPEKDGFNPGQGVDTRGFFNREDHLPTALQWTRKNRAAISWTVRIAEAVGTMANGTKGVIHPGNGKSQDDTEARQRAISIIQTEDSGTTLAIENMYAVRDRDAEETLFGSVRHWNHQPQYWEFGGTPSDMAELLAELGLGYCCLIDLSHALMTANQARKWGSIIPRLNQWQNPNRIIEGFMELRHCPVCHHSGWPEPDRLAGSHGDSLMPVPEAALEAMKTMEVVCLERRWDPDALETTIQDLSALQEALNR